MLLLGVQGLLAAEREDEVKELAGKLHQERMDSVWKGDMLQHLIHQQTDIRPDDVVVHCDANGTNVLSSSLTHKLLKISCVSWAF